MAHAVQQWTLYSAMAAMAGIVFVVLATEVFPLLIGKPPFPLLSRWKAFVLFEAIIVTATAVALLCAIVERMNG
jgi:hypothetical protein